MSPKQKSYLKQSSTDPTTSSASSWGSLPVTLPMLKGSTELIIISVNTVRGTASHRKEWQVETSMSHYRLFRYAGCHMKTLTMTKRGKKKKKKGGKKRNLDPGAGCDMNLSLPLCCRPTHNCFLIFQSNEQMLCKI